MQEIYSAFFVGFLVGIAVASIIWFSICYIVTKLYKEVSAGYNSLYEKYEKLRIKNRSA